jgi:hypothetical protein
LLQRAKNLIAYPSCSSSDEPLATTSRDHQGHTSEVHRLRRARRKRSAIATAAKNYDVREKLVDRLIATPEQE